MTLEFFCIIISLHVGKFSFSICYRRQVNRCWRFAWIKNSFIKILLLWVYWQLIFDIDIHFNWIKLIISVETPVEIVNGWNSSQALCYCDEIWQNFSTMNQVKLQRAPSKSDFSRLFLDSKSSGEMEQTTFGHHTSIIKSVFFRALIIIYSVG